MERPNIRQRSSTKLRCAYCHGRIEAQGISVCSSCRSIQHLECVTKQCPTLGCSAKMEAPPRSGMITDPGWPAYEACIQRYQEARMRKMFSTLQCWTAVVALIMIILTCAIPLLCQDPSTKSFLLWYSLISMMVLILLFTAITKEKKSLGDQRRISAASKH